MAEKLQADPAKLQWTAKQWAEHLDCTDGSVKGTKIWTQTIKVARASYKSERKPHPKRRG